jgi:hypothetical protein
VFPHAAAVSRLIDVDHTIPYLSPDKGGLPGQTSIGNLGPHTRYHHRLKTHAGTHPLGDTPCAQTIWHAAAPHVLAS